MGELTGCIHVLKDCLETDSVCRYDDRMCQYVVRIYQRRGGMEPLIAPSHSLKSSCCHLQ